MPFLGSSSPPAPGNGSIFDVRRSSVALAVRQELVTRRGKAMRLAVYGAVLVITLGSVLLGLDWLSAPMSPMVDTEAGLHAPPAVRPPPAPVAVDARCTQCTNRRSDRVTEPGGADGPERARQRNRANATCAANRRAGAAIAASAMSRGSLHGRLSIVSRVRLHLYAERRAAQALHEITCGIVPRCGRYRRGTGLAARALRLDTATSIAGPTMQFLVYLTVLMVSISTVLLEVHWLTSPAPQPRPAGCASRKRVAAATQVEGPTTALSPVYPKPTETTPAPSFDEPQAQPQQVQATQPRQSQVSSSEAAAPAAAATNPEPQKPAAETTGVAARADETRETATASAVSVQATPSNNRCDVQACSSAYQSFRASDCTYQPFEGPRRICEKAPGQRTARDQTERPERRQWSREAAPRDSERAIGRRVYDDPDESNADDDDDWMASAFFARVARAGSARFRRFDN